MCRMVGSAAEDAEPVGVQNTVEYLGGIMIKRKAWMSTIKTKILLLVIVPLIVMVSLQGIVIFNAAFKELKRQVDGSNVGLASTGATLLMQSLTSAQNTLGAVANFKGIQTMDQATLQSGTKSAHSAYGNFESVVLFDNQGRMKAIEPFVPAMIGQDFSGGDYFSQVKATKSSYIGEPIPSEATKNMVVTVSVPIMQGDTFMGVLMGSVKVEYLQQVLSKNKLVGRGYYFAVNKKGQIFIHPDAKVASSLTDASQSPAIKKVLGGETGNDTAVWQGDVQLLGFTQMPETGWGVVTVQYEKDLYAPFDKLKSQVLGISLLAIILVAVVASIFAIRTTKPIQQLVIMLKDIAEGDGDLKARIKIDSKDELGEVAKWFNVFIAKVQEIMHRVDQSAERVADTSGELTVATEQNATVAQQITRAIDELAKGNSVQTKMINNVSETVMQFAKAVDGIATGAQEQSRNVTVTSQQIKQVADRAKDLAIQTKGFRKSSDQNYQAALNGGQAVSRSIDSMKRIQSAVLDSSEKISRLGQQSQQIGEIIQVIDDIAEQTNLLALNAAIEAARAGEHGKGFAVVADEVRKLAERSGNATKEIASLITGIQKDTTASVQAMQVGTQEVESGVEIVKGTGDALEEILSVVQKSTSELEEILQAINAISESSSEADAAVENVAAITQENTAATEEMAAASSQVEESISNIASIVEQSAASAEELSASIEEVNASTEEIASSAEGLYAMSKELQGLVKQFKF